MKDKTKRTVKVLAVTGAGAAVAGVIAAIATRKPEPPPTSKLPPEEKWDGHVVYPVRK